MSTRPEFILLQRQGRHSKTPIYQGTLEEIEEFISRKTGESVELTGE